MRTHVLSALLLLAAAALPPARAGVEIEAQSAQYDDQAGAFRFTGDVRASGDGIVLTADSLEVDTESDDHLYRARGSPARLEAGAAGGVRAQGAVIEMRLASGRISVDGGSVGFEGVRVQAQRIVRAPGSLEARGGVLLVREGLRIGGDALDAAGEGEGVRITVTGGPATIRGGADDDPLDATALTVLLKADEGLVELSGDVVAQSGGGELAGDLIVYNTRDSTFVATGDERKRVKMVIGEEDDAPAQDAPAQDPPAE